MAKMTHGMSKEEIVAEMRRFIGIDDTERALLAKLRDLMNGRGPAIEKIFYDKIRSEPSSAEFLQGSDVESRHVVSDWLNDLLEGNHDLTYFEKRVRIGVAHVRIGLPIRYPIGMLEVLREQMEKVIDEHLAPDEAKAARRLLGRLLSLDLSIFNHAYEECMFERLDQSAGITRELFYSLMRAANK